MQFFLARVRVQHLAVHNHLTNHGCCAEREKNLAAAVRVLLGFFVFSWKNLHFLIF